jgi:hypothetical protein
MELHVDPIDLGQEAVAQVIKGSPLKQLQDLLAKGKFTIQHFRDGKLLDAYEVNNGIVDVGMNSLLDVGFNAGTQITTWYIGLIDNSGFTALAAGDTMASHTGWTESSDYDEATRPEWTTGSPSARAITNATTVDFTINATKTIKGIFITSNSTKGGTTGTLWSTAAFGSTVPVVDNDVLKVTYTLSG